jgi:hypothetical protein
MTEERMPLTNQSRPTEPAGPTARPLDDPRALQILTTEHWSLLATRSLSWSEAFSRAGLFLSVLSATAVALALVAQAMSFGEGFIAFALVLLPIDLFIGLATFTRLDEVNGEDVIWVAGMNRLRHAYLEIGAGLSPYFITGTFDDDAGIERTYGVHRPGNPLLHWLVTTPGMIAAIDGVLAGLIVGLLVALGSPGRAAMTPAIVVGLAVAAAVAIALALRSRTSYIWLHRAYHPRFVSGDASLLGLETRSTEGEDRGGQPRP